MSRRTWLLLLAASVMAAAALFLAIDRPPAARVEPDSGAAPVSGYEVVREFPHDPDAFTQGLVYHDGYLYESTGLNGRSSLREVSLESGEVRRIVRLDLQYFGEGLTDWGGRLVQLHPARGAASVPGALDRMRAGEVAAPLAALGRRLGFNVGTAYDLATFNAQATFSYRDEGWGLTHDDRRLIMSDGTQVIRFLDPERYTETGSLRVTEAGKDVSYLNELEVVRGGLFANVWQTSRIAVIDLDTGAVLKWVDLDGLRSRMSPRPDPAAGAVLNGIAYDAAGDRLFVTGKLWPRLFEIRVIDIR